MFIGAHATFFQAFAWGRMIVGAGAVVTKDVPSGSIVSGNPAVVIRSGVKTGKWGIRRDPQVGSRASFDAGVASVADTPLDLAAPRD